MRRALSSRPRVSKANGDLDLFGFYQPFKARNILHLNSRHKTGEYALLKSPFQRGRTVIEGLSHMTFIVSDLDKMEDILTTVLDARKTYDSGDKTFSLSKERFFDVGGLWIAIMQGDPLPSQTYNHVAF
jgi:hypothetical protein